MTEQEREPDLDRDLERDRDRDSAGRARNARARDAYGRPLPRGVAGEPTVSDEAAAGFARDPGAALAEAQRLLDADRPFHAHEVLEAVWKSAPDGERELWHGLAQIAVGITHLRRGNPASARTLLLRAVERLESARPDAGKQYGLDLPALVGHLRAVADEVEGWERAEQSPAPVRIALLGAVRPPKTA